MQLLTASYPKYHGLVKLIPEIKTMAIVPQPV